jgi:hypothetical protein
VKTLNALALGLLLLAGCASHVIQPEKKGDWLIQLEEVQISPADFHTTLLGDEPLDIQIRLLSDGQELRPSTSATLPGIRGQRRLKKAMRWLVEFNPQRNYQLVIEEKALVAETSRYAIPPTPKIGKWPFAARDGVVRFGKDSYLKFVLKPVKN